MERTDQPQPKPTPREHPILDRPATPADCTRDYEAGAPARVSSEKRDAHRRR